MHTLAIVGRPNVGKSTLFNRMTATLRRDQLASAITDETPGVTRDRKYGTAAWEEKRFFVIDTGGIFGEAPSGRHAGDFAEITEQVKRQTLIALEEADLVVFLLDGRDGLTAPDREIAQLLRETGKPVICAANKIDTPAKEALTFDFYSLGLGDVIPVSAISGLGFDDLMDRVAELLPGDDGQDETPEPSERIPKISVVGRPNAGKSTLINALLSKQRLIVSATPGTTRDAIDSLCRYYGRRYLFIDTAGIRRRSRESAVESFSVLRALKSIERSDVVIVLIDARQGIVDQDKRIAGIVEELGKGALFLLNKWDLVEKPDIAYKRLMDEMKREFWFMDYVPIVTVSALTRRRITGIFPLIDGIIQERSRRIPDDELRSFFLNALAATRFPPGKGPGLKILSIRQTAVEPPSFVLFVNKPHLVTPQQIRFTEKVLRSRYPFTGTPVRISVKSR